MLIKKEYVAEYIFMEYRAIWISGYETQGISQTKNETKWAIRKLQMIKLEKREIR